MGDPWPQWRSRVVRPGAVPFQGSLHLLSTPLETPKKQRHDNTRVKGSGRGALKIAHTNLGNTVGSKNFTVRHSRGEGRDDGGRVRARNGQRSPEARCCSNTLDQPSAFFPFLLVAFAKVLTD